MAAPERGQRAPRMDAAERRTQLARIAARRFHLVGYHQVSLGDVAADVGLTGPAVYRHFRNKESLLAAATASGLDEVGATIDRHLAGSLDDLVPALARVALDRPDMWMLMQREIRFLGPELRAPLQEQFRRQVDRLADRLRWDRPELGARDARLLFTAAYAVLSAPSTSRTSLDGEQLLHVLITGARACLDIDLTGALPRTGPGADHAHTDPRLRSRREEIVATAVELFFEQGFASVSLDDIGAAVGMAGPSLLHHFPTKADILSSAFDLASVRLTAEQHERRAQRDLIRLPDLVDRYVGFCLENRALLGVYSTEVIHLPDDARERARATVRTELRDWSRALLATSLDMDERTARLRVRTALAAVNDLALLGSQPDGAATRAQITAITLAVICAEQ